MNRRVRAGYVQGALVMLIAGLFLLGLTSCSTVPYTDADQAEDLMDAGRYDEAIVEYTRSINLLPRNPEPYLGRGLAYEKKGQYEQALADFSRAAELDPTDYQIFFVRGLLYDFLGKPQQAIEDYSTSFRLNPSSTDALYRRGLVWEKLGDSRNAVADFRAAALRGDADAQAKLKAMGVTW